jgi:hypothetical protein
VAVLEHSIDLRDMSAGRERMRHMQNEEVGVRRVPSASTWTAPILAGKCRSMSRRSSSSTEISPRGRHHLGVSGGSGLFYRVRWLEG